MTTSNQQIVNNGIYDSVGESSTELILQPRWPRSRIMRETRLGTLFLAILVFPLAIIVPSMLQIALFSWMSPLPGFFCYVIWIIWSYISANLTYHLIHEQGYTTFVFDRTQQQFIINIVNVLGRKVTKIISFDRIEDVLFEEEKDEYISITINLLLKEPTEKFRLTGYSSETYQTVENLKLRAEHEELILQVRTAVGFSNQHLLAKFQKTRSLPTQSELEQARLAAPGNLMVFAKSIFASEQTKQDRLAELRSQTQQSPNDPALWEELALQLSLQKKPSPDEIIRAYRHAQILYLDREDINKADEIDNRIELLIGFRLKK